MATCPAEMLHLPDSNFFFLKTSLSITVSWPHLPPQVSALRDVKMGSSSRFWGPLHWAACGRSQGDCLPRARAPRSCLGDSGESCECLDSDSTHTVSLSPWKPGKYLHFTNESTGLPLSRSKARKWWNLILWLWSPRSHPKPQGG